MIPLVQGILSCHYIVVCVVEGALDLILKRLLVRTDAQSKTSMHGQQQRKEYTGISKKHEKNHGEKNTQASETNMNKQNSWIHIPLAQFAQ